MPEDQAAEKAMDDAKTRPPKNGGRVFLFIFFKKIFIE